MKALIIQEKAMILALSVVHLSNDLQKEKREFVLSKQLMKSATSIGANIEEAFGAFSEKDFIYKVSVSYKEARETKFWLKLLHRGKFIKSNSFEDLFAKTDEIGAMLYSMLKRQGQGLYFQTTNK